MAVTFRKTGHTPSNKTQKFSVTLAALAYSYGKGSKEVNVLKPVIDKISITVPVSNAEERTGYEQQIMDLPKDKDFPEFEPISAKNKYYKYNMNWRHAKTGQAVLIQARPYSSKVVSFLRFEFNPSRLGPDGVKAFKEMLGNIFAHPNLTYAGIIECASFTRLDITCDFVNARAADLIVQGQGKGKKVVYYSAQDDMETTYLDKPKKAASKAKVYDKLQQQMDMEKHPAFEGVTHARVEIQRDGKQLKNLLKGHNILKRVQVIHTTAAPSGIEPWAWDLFLDSCRYRGMEKAIARLPDKMQGTAAKLLKKAAEETWRPEELWKYWPETVAKSGLLDP